MKFVSLRRNALTEAASWTNDPVPPTNVSPLPTAEHHQIHTYTDLRQQIHDDLRIQHPEWVEPDGKSPMCDSYEARLMELLAGLTRRESTSLLLILIVFSNREHIDSTQQLRNS